MIQLKQKGISLLEVLLSIAVGAFIIVMVLRLYSTVHNDMKVNKFLTNVNNIVNASYQWYEGQSQGFTHISGDVLQSAGYIDAVTLDNPWGASITIAPSTPTGESVLIAATVPLKECTLIAEHLANAASNKTTQCTTIQGSYTGIF